ncbi:BON domain-containing protein [Phenylobacterium sp. LjRoot219]|uniref:BON domain-containing protein n=1 Tax=Phenylobacterium sp. LjRoot219 TaxID=3342283 RepID=UPI003ECD8822
MSDWYKGGRDAERGRDRGEIREGREFGGQRRRDPRLDEQRSFEEHPGPSYGEAGRDRRRELREELQAARREHDREYGRGETWRAQPYDERYGREGRGQQDWGHSAYAERHDQRYGDDYAREGRGVVGVNEPVRRVTDGEADSGWRSSMSMGEHRGRGPKNYTRSDERIREDINDRLSDDSWLDASDIEVVVTNCEVTLTGLVHTREDKRRAEDIAERVSGVQHLQNNLRVHPPREFPAVT